MSRPVWTVQLYRENIHRREPSVVDGVWQIVKVGVLGLLIYIIIVLLMV